MSAIATNWKTLLALFVLGLALLFASSLVAVSRSSAPAAASQTTAPVSNAPQEPPISNEIRDFPQLD
ncbi:MAG TPA: hypothetical protein VEQ15_06870 [Myxococcales bacterium]|nr:hypothetical protein [Myxococcales bacterium]